MTEFVTVANPFLSKVNATLRRARPSTPETLNYTIWSGLGEEYLYASVWFRTRGCRFDYRGQCTMCDYWVSTPPSDYQMVQYCRDAIATLTTVPETLVVSPSGSMFDEWEVPKEARQGIFDLVRQFGCTHFVCETRPELVTEEHIYEYTQMLDNKVLSIEMGLESATPWVLRNCINKALLLSDFTRAVQIASAHTVKTLANVQLGAAFLSQREAIEDTVSTVQWALAQQVSNCIIFPAHVKPWTLLHWLWQHNLYSSPSLWSLVEVLRRLGPDACRQVFISWYRPQYGDEYEQYGKSSSQYPTTCPLCRNQVMALLDEYRKYEDYSVIQSLVNIECDCKDAWEVSIETVPQQSLVERIMSYYDIIGNAILGSPRWQRERERVAQQLK